METEKKKWYKRWWAIVLYVFFGLIILGNLVPTEEDNTRTAKQEVSDKISEVGVVKEATPEKESTRDDLSNVQKILTETSSNKEKITEEKKEVCPQFVGLKHTYPEKLWFDNYDYREGTNDIVGWKIGGGWETWEGYFTYCRKGSRPGENVNYNYCGEGQKYLNNQLYAIKRITDTSGIIKETLTKDIIIITDSEGKFIETICK